MGTWTVKNDETTRYWNVWTYEEGGIEKAVVTEWWEIVSPDAIPDNFDQWKYTYQVQMLNDQGRVIDCVYETSWLKACTTVERYDEMMAYA